MLGRAAVDRALPRGGSGRACAKCRRAETKEEEEEEEWIVDGLSLDGNQLNLEFQSVSVGEILLVCMESSSDRLRSVALHYYLGQGE